MRKRLSIALLTAMVFGGLLVLVFMTSASPSRAQILFEQLHSGMSLAEAKGILGEPDVTMPLNANGQPLGYSWGLDEGRIFIFINDAQTVIATDLQDDAPALLQLVRNFIGR
jgi:hypothetical protein